MTAACAFRFAAQIQPLAIRSQKRLPYFWEAAAISLACMASRSRCAQIKACYHLVVRSARGFQFSANWKPEVDV
jgi:hypothetical protein